MGRKLRFLTYKKFASCILCQNKVNLIQQMSSRKELFPLMISFNDLRLQKQQSLFLVPEPLKPYIIDAMKQSNIPCSSVSWRKLNQTYDKKVNDARIRFESAGYENTTCIGGIISCADTEHLFRKCCLFFGDTIDTDFKQMMDEWDKKAHETYETCYKDWLKPGQIPVATK